MSRLTHLTAEDGHEFDVYDTGDKALPIALILCDSLPGLVPHAHRLADRLAAFGYRVLAPDLIARVEPAARLSYRLNDIARSNAIRDQVDYADAVRDIAATAASIEQKRLGIIGFGWGATAAWHAVTELDVFQAAVCFYGPGIAEARQQAPRAPTHLIFAEGDRVIPLADVESIRRAQPAVTVSIYPGTHGFACEEREVYSPDSWADARDDALGFFRRHL